MGRGIKTLRPVIAGAVLMTLAVQSPPAGAQTAKSAALHKIFEDYWEFVLQASPTFATYLGDHRYDDRLEDLSQEFYERRIAKAGEFLARLQAIPLDSLSSADSLNYDLFAREMQEQIEAAQFRPYLLPLSQQEGPHIGLVELTTYHPFFTPTDYENYIKRLSLFPVQVEQILTNLREGLRTGIVPAKVTVEKIIPQIQAQVVAAPESSDLYQPVRKFSDAFSPDDKVRLTDELKNAIASGVIPAYRKLLDFVQREYLPKCRTEAGIWALPDGDQRYRFAVRHYTTTNLPPEEIFELGKKELARIQAEMKKIKEAAGFKGDLPAFIHYLRTDPKFHYPTADSLVAGFKAILRRMDAKLPLLFGKLPQAHYDFREIERFRAAAAPDAYYYPPPEDFSRPGYFYINTYKPESRPKYTMEALAYHEAVPGHHLQIAIQQELTDLPKFRRHGGYTAFVEGWGLYSEQLPKEVGMYQDPYSDFGRLTMEAWRAVRLVVDPGLHFFKWTREQAIEFFKANTALSEQNIVSEVERYIADPGQATAYKIGQLKIRELRAEAEKTLGPQFDVRAFHDELLSDGALPLAILEKKMQRWVVRVNPN